VQEARVYRLRSEYFNKLGLKKLRDKTSRKAFKTYREVFEKRDLLYQLKDREVVLEEFIWLKKILRDGSFQLSFKTFYELYYLILRTMDRLYIVIEYAKKAFYNHDHE